MVSFPEAIQKLFREFPIPLVPPGNFQPNGAKHQYDNLACRSRSRRGSAVECLASVPRICIYPNPPSPVGSVTRVRKIDLARFRGVAYGTLVLYGNWGMKLETGFRLNEWQSTRFLGSGRASRAGFGAPPKRTLSVAMECFAREAKVRDDKGVISRTRGACAPHPSVIQSPTSQDLRGSRNRPSLHPD